MNDLTSNLSQSERLEMCSGAITIPPDSIGMDERTARPVKLSRKQRRTRAICGLNGFKMPSISRVRDHDAALQAFGSDFNVQEEETDEETDEESELRDYAASKRREGRRYIIDCFPSQRSRRDVNETLASMGMAYHD